MPPTQDIVQKLWNLCNILKDDGVNYHQYVTELTFLLFLKMAQETNKEGEIPEGYRWTDLETKNEATHRHALMNAMLQPPAVA